MRTDVGLSGKVVKMKGLAVMGFTNITERGPGKRAGQKHL